MAIGCSLTSQRAMVYIPSQRTLLSQIACSSCRHAHFRRMIASSARFRKPAASSTTTPTSPSSALNGAKSWTFSELFRVQNSLSRSDSSGRSPQPGFFTSSIVTRWNLGIRSVEELAERAGDREKVGQQDSVQASVGPGTKSVISEGPPIDAQVATARRPSTSITQTRLIPSTFTPSTRTNIPDTYREIPSLTLSSLPDLYKGLSKSRLTTLVVLTAMSGYAMCPVDPSAASAAMEQLVQETSAFLGSPSSPDILPPAPSTQPLSTATGNSLDLPTLAATTLGTYLCSSSANSLNQMVEHPYDAQMSRTRNRVVVRKALTPFHAFNFAMVAGTLGVGTLYSFVNPLTATIGLANIVLYSMIYTPLKRVHPVNTWIGALVGALPPLMGWAACTNSLDPLTQPGAWALFALLFFWQFPHFNALAYTLKSDYAKAGYRMLSVLDPQMNARVALRYSLACIPLTSLVVPALGMTSWVFAYLSLIPNVGMAWAAWRFWRSMNLLKAGNGAAGVVKDEKTRKRGERDARILFWASLVHLPGILVLMMACKKGLGESLFGKKEVEEGKGEEEEAVAVAQKIGST